MSLWGYKYRLTWIYGRDVSSVIHARFFAYCAHSTGIDIAPWPPNNDDTTTATYPIAADLYTKHRASGDASVIATVSVIYNLFPPILFCFTSSFLVSDGNTNTWRWPGFSSPLTPSPTPPPGGSLKGTIYYSPQLEMTRSMLHVVVMVINVTFKVEEEEGGGGGSTVSWPNLATRQS